MFIIFGSPRSGTTLLKETLNLHPDLFIPMQTTLISTSAHIAGSISQWDKAADVIARSLVASDDFPVVFGAHFTEAEIVEVIKSAPHSLADALQALYGELARRLGKRECGDKSPDDLLSIRKLEQVGLLNASIRFVHIVRDVRGSVASLLNVDWAPAGIEHCFPRIWNYTNLHLYYALKDRPNYLLVRYEDFVSQPEATLRRLTAFLDVPFLKSMLNASRRGPELRSDPSHRNLAQPFMPDRIEAWRRQLPQEVVKHCEYGAQEGLQTFCYT
ncbi:sulfotransferase domain protein [Burkholderia thailandensis 34]|uniref:Putative sulfotransferase n=1 Tax=Burkholderia thailandensis TaxID=57975 RepID=K9MAV5_BURTH|nr:sulfotransferase [Burkholderia thailandensis]AFU10509.1 putative sulfotransferase [Burkholderia thailandensis]AJY29765.1 sulfotransferase domain protein [Burkholderia thailandensis 34]AOJ57629.1 sulfotransferase [Burkholderia thailandensis]KXF61485.1 sulfotransferase [Burkholderia thailandensis]PNE74433.1 sulfotransferase [Burkholderia thailandensis]